MKEKEILMPWLESEDEARAKRTIMLTQWVARINGDPEAQKWADEIKEFELRMLMFTSYPLGKGRAFRVDSERACR
jgi:hypothetical protein